ncbi:MAG: hypothetical protein R3C18_13660 [Planctomycetaceae bacterium]
MSKTLFVSTVTKEFGETRQRLARVVQRINRSFVRYQEDFSNNGVPTLLKLEEEVAKSDVVVQFIGADAGWKPPREQVQAFLKRHPKFETKYPKVAESARKGVISATQWEAWFAIFFEKRMMAFQIEGTVKRRSSQSRHIRQLKEAGYHPETVGDENQLFDDIIVSIGNIGLLSLAEFSLLTNAEGEQAPEIAGSRILRHAPTILFGRETQLAALDEVWNDGTNVYTLVAWGGVGKTSLVSHWVSEHFAKQGWPGVERYFDWSFYSQGTGESRQTSADLFVQKALEFFGDENPLLGGPWERGERLAKLIRQHRTLLVLDGIEPLQYPVNDKSGQAGRLKDQGLAALIQSLAHENPGLCVITTREHLTNIESVGTTKEEKLDKLLLAAAISLLRHLQVVGTDKELEEAWEDAGGHALTLQLLGRFIARAYNDKDIRHYKEVGFEKADRKRQGRSAFKVMLAYENWLKSAGSVEQIELDILRLTGLFDRPISPGCLGALRSKPAIEGLTDNLVDLDETDWNIAINDLADRDLISLTQPSPQDLPPSSFNLQPSVDAHPLVREYFAEQLQREQPEAFRAAHSRLFDHLCETTEHRPATLQGLQPLYEAVTHGCLAGRHQEACDNVYTDRILRGTGSDGNYSAFQLGAIGADLGAVAAFFDLPWSQVSPNLKESDQAWLLNEAAFSLRALGRLTEALEPLRATLDINERDEQSKYSAVVAGNLSELEVTLGQLPQAVADGRRAVEFADQTDKHYTTFSNRCKLADALHQSGETGEAQQLFAEAETMQTKIQPDYPLLYSARGFRYVDLLLSPAEQAAWQTVLRGDNAAPFLNAEPSALNETCDEADRRATQTLQWALNNRASLLDIALDHLTLARSALYRALLSGDVPETLAIRITTALSKLRESNNLDDLPKALLTTAWYYATLGEQPNEAKRLLDEAEQIARRGPMPLYLADIHLHRARLFRDREELEKARALIKTHGYGRRLPELQDADAVAANWR